MLASDVGVDFEGSSCASSRVEGAKAMEVAIATESANLKSINPAIQK